MECIVCMELLSDDYYKIQCGSSVQHALCHECEVGWRAKMPLQNHGFSLSCPVCRGVETRYNPTQGKKSMVCEILMLEMTLVLIRHGLPTLLDSATIMETINGYAERYVAKLSVRQKENVVREKWNRLRQIHALRPDLIDSVPMPFIDLCEPPARRPCESGKECPTKSRTQRQCRYPGCSKRVCRACYSCIH